MTWPLAALVVVVTLVATWIYYEHQLSTRAQILRDIKEAERRMKEHMP
jgi:heme exporter protein D